MLEVIWRVVLRPLGRLGDLEGLTLEAFKVLKAFMIKNCHLNMAILGIWSMLLVSFVHPINFEIAEQTDLYADCDRCARAFQSIPDALYTLIETVMFSDSWGAQRIVNGYRVKGCGVMLQNDL